jgi:hypothetical protein
MHQLKTVYHIIVSSAETIGAFNTGFEPVIGHGPTMRPAVLYGRKLRLQAAVQRNLT